MKEHQLYIENTYHKSNLQKQYQELWYPILSPLVENQEPTQELEDYIKDIIKILFILSEKVAIPYDTMMSILISSWGRTNKADHITRAANLLDIGTTYNLWSYRQIPVNDHALEIRANYFLPERVQKHLDSCFYKLPMVIRPKKVKNHTNNKGSGYLLNHNDNLILNTLKEGGDICREFLDKVNRVQFTLNQDLLDLVTHEPHLDKLKDRLTSRKDTSSWELMALAQKNWKQFLNQREIVIEELKGKPFYLTHKYDTRGRCYAQGYHINYQGDSYCKAMVYLANKEIITDEVEFNLL